MLSLLFNCCFLILILSQRGSELQLSEPRKSKKFRTSKRQSEHQKLKRSEHRKCNQNANYHNIKKNIKSQTNQTFDILILSDTIGKKRITKVFPTKETFDKVILPMASEKIRTERQKSKKCQKLTFDILISSDVIGNIILSKMYTSVILNKSNQNSTSFVYSHPFIKTLILIIIK